MLCFRSEDNSGDSSEYEGPPTQAPKGPSGRTMDDEKGTSRSVFRRLFGPTGSRDSSLSRGAHGRTDAETSGGASAGPRHFVVGMERLSSAVSQLLVAVDSLTDWESTREKASLTAGQLPTSGLQRWLVRLHIVNLYLQRLPKLRAKLLEETGKRIVARCPRDVEVIQHLRQLGAQVGKDSSNSTNWTGTQDALHPQQQEELVEITSAVDDAIEAIIQKLQETAKEVSRYDGGLLNRPSPPVQRRNDRHIICDARPC